MSIRRNKNQLIISIIFGIVVFAIVHKIISDYNDLKHQVVVLRNQNQTAGQTQYFAVSATKPIMKGEAITKDNTERKQIPVKLDNGFDKPDNLIGLVVIKDIKQGLPVTKDCFAPEDLPTTSLEPRIGYRSVVIPGVSGIYLKELNEGEFIDIYSSDGLPVAKNVRILKLSPKGANQDSFIMFEIKAEDVSAFKASSSSNKLSFAKKNPKELENYQVFNVKTIEKNIQVQKNNQNNNYSSDEVAQMPRLEPVYEELEPIENANKTQQNKKATTTTSPQNYSRQTSEVEVISGNKKTTVQF